MNDWHYTNHKVGFIKNQEYLDTQISAVQNKFRDRWCKLERLRGDTWECFGGFLPTLIFAKPLNFRESERILEHFREFSKFSKNQLYTADQIIRMMLEPVKSPHGICGYIRRGAEVLQGVSEWLF